jgi:MFS family permease
VPQNHRPGIFYGYIVVAVAFLIMFIMWGAYYSFGIFFKPLLAEFGWTRAMTSAAYSLSFILTGVFGVAAGRLTDRFGPRIVVTVCGFFLGLGYFLVSQTSAIWQLYLFYGVVVALGMSSGVIPLQSTIARWFVRRRGLMTGLIVSGIGVGMLVVPLVADWLISTYGWRTSYIVVGVAALLVVTLAAQFLRRDPASKGLLPFGADQSEAAVSSLSKGFSLEEALKTRQFWLLSVATLCFTMAEGTVLVHIVPHAIGLGVPSTSAAAIIAIIGGISIGGRVLMGSAGDRIGNKRAWMVCLTLMTISLFWLLVAGEMWMLYLFAVVFGFGYGGLSVLLSPMAAEFFGLSSHGVIFGLVIMFGGTGGMAIGPVIAGHIFDVTGSYYLAFLIYAIVCVVGLLLTSMLRPTRLKAISGAGSHS